MKHLNHFNNFKNESHYDSSITKDDAEELIYKIHQYHDALSSNEGDWNDSSFESFITDLESKCKDRLYIYDRENSEFVINCLFRDSNISADDIIRVGDEIMNKFGTEPHMVIEAFEDCFSIFTANKVYIDDEEEETNEKVKAQRYRGHRIPGKYLTKNPGKMKKEIDKYRGKREYKKDWDADYSSGKGGVGKRVKTKKSAATKAYQRMFGESLINEGLMTYLGIGTALLILRFIIRVFRSISKYNHIMKSVIQAANMFSHLKMTKYKREGDDFKAVDKDMDALQVVEYSDKYWIKFIPENAPISSIRVFKMEEDKKVTKMVIELKDKMDEFPLPQRYYDELLEIIKRKL